MSAIAWRRAPARRPRDELGQEQPAAPRPLLTRDEAIDRLNQVFVLATTNICGLPSEVELGLADGMPRDCVLNADSVASVPKGYLGDIITTLTAERLAEVCRALDHATGC